jgi:hypothetical protein
MQDPLIADSNGNSAKYCRLAKGHLGLDVKSDSLASCLRIAEPIT